MKTTLITGASSGIGLELAKIFAKEGHDLILVARSKTKLELLKKEIEEEFKVKAYLAVVDLSKTDSPEKLKESLKKNEVSVEILVNNAGFGDYGEFKDSDIKKQEEMINLNILALTKLTRIFLPEIIQNKGKILNVASVAGFMPGPLMSVYYATKAYVISFSEALAEELKENGVSVTVLCPGPVKTNFAEVAQVNKNMFSGNIPGPKEVAEYGYEMLMKSKIIAVHGTQYKFLTKLPRFLPRKTIRTMVNKVHKQKK